MYKGGTWMQTLDINLGHKNYEIIIQWDIIDKLAEFLTEMKVSKIAVITDRNIYKIHGDKIKTISKNFDMDFIIVEPGEDSKSTITLQHVYKELIKQNITRSDMIITFGGGVVGDLGGFAASTFLRGVPYAQIPTSLIAQIDSSIGGKVGIDLPEGKNLIGSFYHPEVVFIDPGFLETLDERYFNDGMAEVIKYGCIADPSLFMALIKYEDKREVIENIGQIIYRCCSIKKGFVEEDEKDDGSRRKLNFGHTLGHGIEQYYNYKRYTHGEAVAIGMCQITKRSEELGLTKSGTSLLIKSLLNKYNLPYNMDFHIDEILEVIKLDKKGRGQYINIVLLKSIGNSFIQRVKKKDIRNYFP